MARQTEYLEELRIAIRLKHYCEPVHKESVFVHEIAGDETAWKGYVEVFELMGHTEARTCYAWLDRAAKGIKILTVMGNQLIDSAQKAVRAAIFMDAQLAFSPDVTLLNTQLELAEKALRQLRIKWEDLDAAIQATRQTKENFCNSSGNF